MYIYELFMRLWVEFSGAGFNDCYLPQSLNADAGCDVETCEIYSNWL